MLDVARRSGRAAEGNDGCIARVNFPAPSLKSKIDGEGKPSEKIKQLAGTVFSRLFIPTITFKPVENFRDEAKALLAKGEANKLIKLCQTEIAPRVSFETAERGAVFYTPRRKSSLSKQTAAKAGQNYREGSQ